MGIKYKVNENFFKTWKKNMAYVLGYIYADGSLENAFYIRGRYFKVSSIDKELVMLVKKALDSEHKIVTKQPILPTRKIGYLLRIGSHKIYNDLIALGLYPNKSLTIKFPDIPIHFMSDFVRGYFDGDGHVAIKTQRGRIQEEIFKKLWLAFTSGSYMFLDTMAQILGRKLDLRIKKVYKSNKSFQLAYSTEDSVKLFKYLYKDANQLFLKRKFGTFYNFFKRYPHWADKEIAEILKANGAVAK